MVIKQLIIRRKLYSRGEESLTSLSSKTVMEEIKIKLLHVFIFMKLFVFVMVSVK